MSQLSVPVYVSCHGRSAQKELIQLAIPGKRSDYGNRRFTAHDRQLILEAFKNCDALVTEIHVGDRIASCVVHRREHRKSCVRRKILGSLGIK